MWKTYLEKALQYKMLADYYRKRDMRNHQLYYEKYVRNQKRFVMEYEKGRFHKLDYDSPAMESVHPISQAYGRLRILHGYTSFPEGFDLYLNNRLVAQNVPFAAITSYLRLPAGSYHLQIFPTGKKEDHLLDQMISVGDDAYTLVLIDDITGASKQPSLLSYEDDLQPVEDRAKVRLIHLSPNAPRVDVAIKEGNVLFSQVGYTDARFISLPAGSYDLELRISGTDQVIYTIPRVRLEAKKIYSIFAVGRVRGNPAFRVLVVLDQ